MKQKYVCCEQCSGCVYIGEGDFMCGKFSFNELVLVLTNYSRPTDDYLKCKKNDKRRGDL